MLKNENTLVTKLSLFSFSLPTEFYLEFYKMPQKYYLWKPLQSFWSTFPYVISFGLYLYQLNELHGFIRSIFQMRRLRESVSPHLGFSRPSTRAHVAQTWHPALEGTGRCRGMPLCGISEQKFTLLPFINQSDSFNHVFPESLSWLSQQTTVLTSAFRKHVSSSVA